MVAAMVDVENELLKPPSTAPLTAEPIYASFPVLVGGPRHGEPVPVTVMKHIELPVAPTFDRDRQAGYPTAMYERGKFASSGSRRVLHVWYFTELTEDERSAMTWLLILERAGLTDA